MIILTTIETSINSTPPVGNVPAVGHVQRIKGVVCPEGYLIDSYQRISVCIGQWHKNIHLLNTLSVQHQLEFWVFDGDGKFFLLPVFLLSRE